MVLNCVSTPWRTVCKRKLVTWRCNHRNNRMWKPKRFYFITDDKLHLKFRHKHELQVRGVLFRKILVGCTCSVFFSKPLPLFQTKLCNFSHLLSGRNLNLELEFRPNPTRTQELWFVKTVFWQWRTPNSLCYLNRTWQEINNKGLNKLCY